MNAPVSPTKRTTLTIARIVKVNHGGEVGAIKIYQAQIWLARRLFPDVVESLNDILENEKRHCAAFYDAMPARNARPCHLMGLWSLGGFVLGACTAVLGRRAVWICTSAVEHAVHRHMVDQLEFLARHDSELHEIVRRIQEDELRHLDTADSRLRPISMARRILHPLVFAVTDLVIWLSTSGDSSRLQRDLKPR